MLRAPTATALPITPYMWKPWNQNISWILNHESTSAFVRITPKRAPSASDFTYFIVEKGLMEG